ncbi:exodeoxyribonuclease VII large subunit [Glycocaulis alkaliphilus]|uniref:Exodeoxyribonuclease 7 large subunit n=1 Tax=Glycocaulis alkaliphilus TaxID=1434191 RepID=A0A3T0E964_9PROT|nr:exodeoxyribonuclease VII large subunit [Glycocaulis alkaliphilus]AZU03800.1 exodeoxyribonuclease VII large subunit [Glycocaulis alkaliphilus]GGB84014.1 exodeoxyribonuclease 7 large subunit [Glycocaulis alkaliphilus]
MTDLTNAPEYTVSDLARALKRTVETEYGHVRVRGELGRVTIPKSGHMYLDLKDAEAVIDGVMWKGSVSALSFRPEEGLEVIVEGRLSTFPGRSKYQIIIERMEPAGAGALMALLEERKRKLAAEGLFAPERKAAIPYLPRVVGVVTSPTGAVIRDILHRLDDRFPVHVLIWPVLVQGEGAAAQIAAGIEGFNAIAPGGPVPRPDVLIVARGGGSVEDLWAFNEEIVVRAAAASQIPLISAVGHETDTTLIDFASDRRAPTPTGAAEMAVPVRRELMERIEGARGRLSAALLRTVERKGSDLRSASRGLPRPESLLGDARQRLDYAHEALVRGLTLGIERRRGTLERLAVQLRPLALKREIAERRQRLVQAGERMRAAKLRRLGDDGRRLAALTSTLEALSYHNVLKRGYAIIEDGKGALVRSAGDLAPGDAVTLRLHDGERAAAIAGGVAPPRKDKPASKPKSTKTASTQQGSLF